MNDEPLHPYIEPELEARIVALVLGEASDFEREELERLFAERPELKLFHDRIESTDLALKEIAIANSDEEDWKLSDQHRKTVLDTIDPNRKPKIAVEEIDRNKIRRAKFRLVRTVVASIAVAVVAMLLVVGAAVFTSKEAKRSMTAGRPAELATVEHEGTVEARKMAYPQSPRPVDHFAPVGTSSTSVAVDTDALTYSPNKEAKSESITKKIPGLGATEFSSDVGYAQLGHGGVASDPYTDGDIALHAGASVSFDAEPSALPLSEESEDGRFHMGATATFGDEDFESKPKQETTKTETSQETATAWVSLGSGGKLEDSGGNSLSFPDVTDNTTVARKSDEPMFTRDFLGGANSMRGYDYRDVAPIELENGNKVAGLFSDNDNAAEGSDDGIRVSPELDPFSSTASGSLIASTGNSSGGTVVIGGGATTGDLVVRRNEADTAEMPAERPATESTESIADLRKEFRELDSAVRDTSLADAGREKQIQRLNEISNKLREQQHEKEALDRALNEADPTELASEETERYRMNYYDAAYDHTRTKMLREVAAGWETPVLENTTSNSNNDIAQKSKSIILPSLEFHETPLHDALEFLQQRSIELDIGETDPTRKGFNIVVDTHAIESALNDPDILHKPITLRLSNVPMTEALRYTTALAGLEFEVEPHAIVVQPIGGKKEPTKSKKDGTTGNTHLSAAAVDSRSKILPKQIAPVKAPPGLDETKTKDEPFSTFSLHVSDVSFKLAQAALAKGEWPDKSTVRVEEFVNAFDYGDPKPTMEEKVACQMEQAAHPFLQQRNLLRVSMRTAAQGRNASTPLRLTFLLDNSGSMERSDRQETVRRAFSLLTSQLQPNDQVTLISFARQPRLLADKVSGDQGSSLIDTIANLPSEGGTNLEAALTLAFEKAQEQHDKKAQNRIILLTDGAANLGNAEPEDLASIVESMRNAGIAFDAAGIGTEGLNDEILESLTRKGDGRYYLLDRPEDADAGFAKQIAGALRPAAGNVKVQVKFNPDRVTTYKLLGFEKHRLNKEDFRNDKVDAAELAAEEAGVALYQFQPNPEGKGDIGFVSVRFRDMTSGEMVERRWPIAYQPGVPRTGQASPTLRLATSAAFLASRLKEEPLGEVVELDALSQFLNGLPQRLEENEKIAQLREMIRKTREISGR